MIRLGLVVMRWDSRFFEWCSVFCVWFCLVWLVKKVSVVGFDVVLMCMLVVCIRWCWCDSVCSWYLVMGCMVLGVRFFSCVVCWCVVLLLLGL